MTKVQEGDEKHAFHSGSLVVLSKPLKQDEEKISHRASFCHINCG